MMSIGPLLRVGVFQTVAVPPIVIRPTSWTGLSCAVDVVLSAAPSSVNQRFPSGPVVTEVDSL